MLYYLSHQGISPVTIWNSYNMGLINLWVEGLLSVSWVNISERAKLVIPDLPSQGNHLGPLLRMLLLSHWVMSDSLWFHGPQHARLPCPSLSPGVCSDLCPLSRWGHPTISSSVAPFSSYPQSFPASVLFQWVGSLHQVAKVLELQHEGFPQWLSRLRICLQCGRHKRWKFNSWVRKIPWRRKMATHSNIVARKNPTDKRSCGRLQPKGSERVRHAWATKHIAQKSC